MRSPVDGVEVYCDPKSHPDLVSPGVASADGARGVVHLVGDAVSGERFSWRNEGERRRRCAKFINKYAHRQPPQLWIQYLLFRFSMHLDTYISPPINFVFIPTARHQSVLLLLVAVSVAAGSLHTRRRAIQTTGGRTRDSKTRIQLWGWRFLYLQGAALERIPHGYRNTRFWRLPRYSSKQSHKGGSLWPSDHRSL